jgi:hypothetical protein
MAYMVELFSKPGEKMIDIGWPIGLLQVLWQLGSMVLYLILSVCPNIESKPCALTAVSD